MMIPLVRSAAPTANQPDLQAAQILLLSEASMYLNSKLIKKLQLPQWLISATLPEFNHLRGSYAMMEARLDLAASPAFRPALYGR